MHMSCEQFCTPRPPDLNENSSLRIPKEQKHKEKEREEERDPLKLQGKLPSAAFLALFLLCASQVWRKFQTNWCRLECLGKR